MNAISLCHVCMAAPIANWSQAVDDPKSPRCQQCHQLLRKIKGKKYSHESGIGHVCQLCYNMNRCNQSPIRRTASAPTRFLLSPAQRSTLVSTMELAGIGQQGRTRSVPDNARALLLVHTLQEAAPVSYDKAVKIAAQVEQTSPRILRSASKRFQRKNHLLRSPSKLPRINRDHPLHALYLDSGPTLAVQNEVYALVDRAQKENRYISLTTIQLQLKEKFNKHFPKRTLHEWMVTKMELEYGELKWSPVEASFANARIRSYLIALAAAMKEEEAGTAIIVYMDESYIHQGQRTKFSWYCKKTERNNIYQGHGPNSGKRIIVLHAVTKDGMLAMPGVDPSNILTEEYLSCALVFAEVNVDDITPADYHNSINGEKFVMWMRTRLIPTFKARYPGKKMYLVLDNAKYHHHRGEDWLTPAKMNLGQCARFLRENAVREITITSGKGERQHTYVVKASKFSADRKDGGPTMAGIRDAVKTYLLSHPGMNTTVPRQLMDDAKFSLIYTPPYESWLQPIELVWARMKHTVSTQAFLGRTHQETAAQTYASFDHIDGTLCSSLLSHVRKLIDSWLQTDAAGSLQRFQSMSGLMAATKAEIEASHDLYVEDNAVVRDKRDREEEEEE
jgi:hypothetical protein